MPRFVVEREIPGAGPWTPDQPRKASQKSIDVHAARSGFHANRISHIHARLDPTSAER